MKDAANNSGHRQKFKNSRSGNFGVQIGAAEYLTLRGKEISEDKVAVFRLDFLGFQTARIALWKKENAQPVEYYYKRR